MTTTTTLRHVARHEIAFAAETSGSHPLTWAQRFQLGQRCKPHVDGLGNVNVRMVWPLEGAPDLASVTRAIGRVVERSESLRSRYPRVGDVYGDPVVLAEGSVTAEQYAAEAPHDTEALRDLAELMAKPGFGLDDPPVRFAVVTVHDTPTDLVLTLHHGAADAIGAEVIARHVARLAADPEARLRVSWQPREIAAYEQSEAGRAYARDADAHDRAALADAPMPLLAGPREEPAGVLYHFVSLKSRALAPAIGLLAARHRVTAAAVLLAAYSRALAEHGGLDQCAVNLVASNRQTPQTRESVAHLVGVVLCAVDVRAQEFGELCRAAGAAMLRALRYGRRDPELFTASLDQASATLGRPATNAYFVNIRPIDPGRLAAAAAEPAEIAALAAASELADISGHGEVYSGELTFDVWDVGETSALTLGTDSSSYDAPALAAILRRIETVLYAAV
ncbi:hypothetical protein KDL01_19825 [Actinospica durhamensis]|uniref:Condensation domain-containing protein n=1 Tax=Actinospica durhamensis TaxID=1508375 RepID=A0A941EN90_9ACTN|nr:condensation domain-containing protein [Actinospica durhamensis]MBR7835535.1 hypothetical protein [Actinospica durhamensis]